MHVQSDKRHRLQILSDHTQKLLMYLHHKHDNLSIHNNRVILEIKQEKSEKALLLAWKKKLGEAVKK